MEIIDPDGDLPEVGEEFHHKGHRKETRYDTETGEPKYEPSYDIVVRDRVMQGQGGSELKAFVEVEVTDTEDEEFFDVGDVFQISSKLLKESEYYTPIER